RYSSPGIVLLLIGMTHCYPQFDNGNQFGGFGGQNPWLRPPQPVPSTISPDLVGGSTTTARPTTQSPLFYACLQSCAATSEYNPICGSDNVSYYNENRFNCALRCGNSKKVNIINKIQN
ncbi:hypothetical protein KR084_009154, partial [Drosophila pseudotakahashii]